MGKIITFYNHKGGVGKTTLVHNIGFALADLGKKVLLIDADPQMNLTSAMYGLSTAVEYSMNEGAKWREYTEQYTSFVDHINEYLLDEKLNDSENSKEIFQVKSKHNQNGKIDLISGSILISNIEAKFYNIITNKNDYNTNIPYKFEKLIREKAKDYDLVLIDTSPSASSIINALSVMTSDYFIVPVSPTFFSLQAVDNLTQVITNWNNLLRDYQQTIGKKGISLNSKFLGLVIQMGKRFNGGAVNNTGYSKSTEDWITEVNKSVKRFVSDINKYEYAISSNDFQEIFSAKNPYIIEKCCDFTAKLRAIAEKEGVPVIYLTQDICDKYNKNVDVTMPTRQYARSLTSINQSYRYIAESLTKLL